MAAVVAAPRRSSFRPVELLLSLAVVAVVVVVP
jgi:hypothetical protein